MNDPNRSLDPSAAENTAESKIRATDDDATRASNVSPTGPAAPSDATDEATTSSLPSAQEGANPLRKAQEDLAEVKEKYLRTAADFDNFRKRSRRDAEDAERRGKETLLRELLPVFDNLERASMHTGQAPEAKAVAEGIGMVLRQFADTLGRLGIKRVPTVGTAFDPTMHEAIQQIETSDQAPGTVVAEIQGGYLLGDKLMRAAMVVVAKAPRLEPVSSNLKPKS